MSYRKYKYFKGKNKWIYKMVNIIKYSNVRNISYELYQYHSTIILPDRILKKLFNNYILMEYY